MLAVVVLLVIALSGYGVYTVRASYPQTAGTLQLPGLVASVSVQRDALGVPRIIASNVHDLFYAQGFVHAQDRMYEMDVRRHITSGRLSEMFGKSQVPTDTFLRTLGWRRIAEQEVELLNPRSRMILDAYAEGVNAYLADHQGASASLEYAVLGLQNPGYVIEPWQPADSVAWLKALAWELRGNMEEEIYRAIMSASVGVEHTAKLSPEYPYAKHPPIVQGGAVVNGHFESDATVTPGGGVQPAALPRASAAVFSRVDATTSLLAAWLGEDGPGIGSNSWAVAGSHTTTGKPLLANDPHLAPAMPSLWYQSALRCTALNAECNYDVAGWTMAGLPGVFIGHNSKLAWGFTNLGPDVTDLVLEKVSGDQYLVDNTQHPLTIRTEVVKVAGGAPVTITIRSTADGPIISDIPDLTKTYPAVGQDAPVPAPGAISTKEVQPDRGDGYAVALRWTALTPAPTFDAFDKLNTANNWDDFRNAAKDLAVPAQNLLYADVDGNIGYQAPGRIPIRSNYDGMWPIPGWSTRYSWTGEIPFDALPSELNPKSGWIVTANQAVIGPQYPYFMTNDWTYGSRSARIMERVSAAIAAGPVSADQMRQIQMDSHNELAEFLAPKLPSISNAPELSVLRGWDFTQPTDSAAAALFNAIWKQMVTRMFDAAADTELIYSTGGDRFWTVVENIWDTPNDFWWDDKTVAGTQSRDDTIRNAVSAAVAELNSLQGSDPTKWNWGALHTLTFTNQTLGKSGIAPIERLFNRGPVPTAGGEAIVNANGWTPKNGYVVDWVPSMRQVVDLSNFDASTWVNLTGQSGHAYNANYSDQIDAWQSGAQYPWAFSQSAVDASTENTLILEPTNSQ